MGACGGPQVHLRSLMLISLATSGGLRNQRKVCEYVLRPPALGVAVLPYFHVCYFAYYFDCVQVLPVSRGRSPICFKARIAVQKASLLQLRAATLFGLPRRSTSLIKFSVLYRLFVY